jgi:hypothetical protein
MKRYPTGEVKEECHIYVLNDDPLDYFEVDEYLIRWMQAFEEEEGLQESAFSGKTAIYVHDRNGNPITPPGKHRNPFPFALESKYDGKIERIHRKYRLDQELFIKKKGELKPGEKRIEEDRIDRKWDLEKIFRKAIMEWPPKKDIPIPAYFDRALEWSVKNLEKGFRERFIKVPDPDDPGKTRFVLKEDFYHGGSLNEPIDKEENRTEKINLLSGGMPAPEREIDWKRLLDSVNHPIDKLILVDASRSDAELVRELKTQGIQFTSRYVNKRRKKLYAHLRAFLKK